jgi:DNA polymerase-3 subunit epsilon
MLRKWRYSRRCRNLAKECRVPALSEYLLQCSTLKAGNIENTPMIAADLELTGLESSHNQIIAIGWTQIDKGRIRMGSNRHLLVKANQTVGSSAAIHELMDSEVAQGVDLEHGLEALFEAAQGRVWVFHHAGLDISFLKKACEDWGGVVPGFNVLDTMRIEYRLRRRRDKPVRQGDLQLGNIRELYGLPRYTAHNALIDALATAELLLAIAAQLEPEAPLELEPHIKYF